MRGVKDKGLEELKDFKNRLTRSHGLERINKQDFQRLYEKINDLIEDVEGIDEEHE